MTTSISVINKVLADMRLAISNKKCIPIPRKLNMDTLAMLGITWKDAFNQMLTLSSSDFISGPEIDRNYPNSDCLWIFKKNINGDIIYIKFKIEYQQKAQMKIISFHLDGT